VIHEGVEIVFDNTYRLLTEYELTRLWRRFNQLADTFHATDPTTGQDVFEILEGLRVERARRLPL
jgi:hypothetical protein